MVERDIVLMSLPTGLATGIVATAGFVVWIRLRRKIFPTNRDIFAQFLFSSVAASVFSYRTLNSRRQNEDALLRMMKLTAGIHELTSSSSELPNIAYNDQLSNSSNVHTKT